MLSPSVPSGDQESLVRGQHSQQLGTSPAGTEVSLQDNGAGGTGVHVRECATCPGCIFNFPPDIFTSGSNRHPTLCPKAGLLFIPLFTLVADPPPTPIFQTPLNPPTYSATPEGLLVRPHYPQPSHSRASAELMVLPPISTFNLTSSRCGHCHLLVPATVISLLGFWTHPRPPASTLAAKCPSSCSGLRVPLKMETRPRHILV